MWKITGPSQPKEPKDVPNLAFQFAKVVALTLGSVSKVFRQIWKIKTIMNEAIDYSMEGEAKDHEWILANRTMLESYLIEDMREKGFIPVLDASAGLSYAFNEEKQTFDFSIKAKAVQVGRQKSQQYMGIILGEGIMVSKDAENVALYDSF